MKIKRVFNHVGAIIRTHRELADISQSKAATLMAEKGHIVTNQFFSNIERGLCSLPLKHFIVVSEILRCDPDDLEIAYLKDLKATIKGIRENIL